MNCSIIIPSYNEDSSIYLLINELIEIADIPIIIIDDGSKNPITVSGKNITVLRNKKNRGKGYSIIKGIKHSYGMKLDYSIVMDADFQHNPNHIKDFIEADSCDMVLGYRNFSKPMPFQRIISNKLTSFIISRLIRKKIIDSQTGYRRYKNSIIKTCSFKEQGFQFESEILLKLGKFITIKQIPIDTIYNNSKTHINPFYDTLGFIKLIFKHILYGFK